MEFIFSFCIKGIIPEYAGCMDIKNCESENKICESSESEFRKLQVNMLYGTGHEEGGQSSPRHRLYPAHVYVTVTVLHTVTVSINNTAAVQQACNFTGYRNCVRVSPLCLILTCTVYFTQTHSVRDSRLLCQSVWEYILSHIWYTNGLDIQLIK